MTACTGKSPAPSSGSTPTIQVAMGRYVEEEISFPEGIEHIALIKRMPDNSIQMIVSKTPDRIQGPWFIYRTEDNGITWVEQDAPWLEQFAAATISAADFAVDGSLVMAYVTYTDELKASMEEAIAAQDYEAAMAMQPKYHYVSVDTQGTVKELDIELPASPDGGDGSPADLCVTDSGDLIVNDYYTLYQFDTATGKVKNKYQPGTQPRAFIPCGDSFALVDNGEISIFNLESGEKTEAIVLPTGDTGGMLAWDGKAVYYSGSTGIYRRVAGGAVLEQVVDGALTSLNMPALHCRAIFPSADSSFLALFSGEVGYSTLRYRYSEEISTLPEKQLRVYSLNDNKNIRQAMGLYQRNHPDTQVVFEVGLPSDSTLTVSDALRTLSTQLLAGKGPDIMVLDGMPVESYIEKKVLLELDSSFAQGLLQNIVEASREQDGKLYAMPARFKVPVALADSKAADSITNLTTLADYQAGRIKEMAAIPPTMGNPMHPIPAALISTFYPLCAPAWEQQDGTLDTAAISQFLTDIKKITDAAGKESWQEIPPEAGANYDLPYSAAYWLYGHIPMAYGHSDEFFGLAPLEEAIVQKGDGKVFLLPGQISSAFIPQTILGINSAGQNIDAAKEFVKLVLSQEVQSCQFSGYAVNEASFDKSAVNPFPPTDDGYTYGTVEADGSYRYLQVIWPDDAYMEQMKAMIKSVNHASRVDVVALQMVIDETIPYFLGDKSLDDTVTALTEKLRLYLSE
ncbi:MAG: hypothetical protein RSF82_01730 [Angelakisella sp.]